MNKSEAYDTLSRQLAEYFDYEDLAQRIETRPTEEFTIRAKSGVKYHVKLEFAKDKSSQDKIRMVGSVVPVDERRAEPLTQVLLVPKPSQPRA